MKKKMTYKEFCKKYHCTSLNVEWIKIMCRKYNLKIVDLHNIIDDAKADGRL